MKSVPSIPAQVEVAENAETSYSIVSNSRASGLRTHLHATGACDRFDCRHIEAFPSGLAIAHLGYLMLLKALEEKEDSELKAVRALRSLQEKADKVAVDIVSLDDSPERFRKIVTPCLPEIDYLIINEFEAGQIVGQRFGGRMIASTARPVAEPLRSCSKWGFATQ